MLAEINSNAVFERYNMIWRLNGFHLKNPSTLKRAYRLFLIIVVTICYPLHLIIGLLQLTNPKDIVSNLLVNIACCSCSIKFFVYFSQFDRMKDTSRLLKELDRHVITKEDREFHNQNMQIMTRRLLNMFIIVYEIGGVAAFFMWFMMEQPSLFLPAWFPFDWKSSTWTHMLAIVYQMLGLQVEIIQNVLNDAYVPIALCLLSGQTRLLVNRLARIGYDENKSEKDHYADLVECAEDYQRLTRLFNQIQETISWNMLLQSVTIGVNLCVNVIFLVFYAETVFEYGFGFCTIVAISLEFYPGCYYGSSVEKSFHDLTYAMFSCNWLNRDPAFKRSLRILTEFTLRPATMYAKRTVKINLDTYFNTMRLSYSLFCVVLRMK